MSELTEKKCLPCESGVDPLNKAQAEKLLAEIEGWELSGDATEITKLFQFKGFYKTMAFVNALAWIAQQEGHHPDMTVTFNSCKVRYQTHALNGLSENDFICAAKIDALI